MQITLEIKCPTCLSDSIKKNGIKVDGKQNYQCKDCKRQFIGDHALSYLGCNSGITRKILQLMVRGATFVVCFLIFLFIERNNTLRNLFAIRKI